MTASLSQKSAELDPSFEHSEVPSASAVPKAGRGRRWVGLGLAGCGVLGALFGAGYLPKQREASRLAGEAELGKHVARRVVLTKARVGKGSRSLSLPATLEGLEQTEVYARANGYVRSFSAELGQEVKAGQVLAELDTPELDHELEQARAQLARSSAAIGEAEATHAYSLAALTRYRRLVPEGVASSQDLEQKDSQAKIDEAHLAVARAELRSQSANVRKLEQLQSFSKVLAPFAGTITERNVARGRLVAAGTGQRLFKISTLDPVRAFIQVPQSLVAGLKPGLPTQLHIAEQRARTWTGVVAHTASVLDPTSRTMTVEVRVPNADHALLPGMYAELTLQLETPTSSVLLPGSAVAAGKEGVRVATVDERGVVHWRVVHVERDDGAEVEISQGLTSDERVIASPGPDISDGMIVRAAD